MNYVEDLWIKFKTTFGPVVMGAVYRHPTNTTETYERFSEKLIDICNDLNSNNGTFYALGDYNIDLMKVQTNNNVRMYVNNMISRLVNVQLICQLELLIIQKLFLIITYTLIVFEMRNLT